MDGNSTLKAGVYYLSTGDLRVVDHVVVLD
jgi:hypothetical protein